MWNWDKNLHICEMWFEIRYNRLVFLTNSAQNGYPFSNANTSQIRQVWLATRSSVRARLTQQLWPAPTRHAALPMSWLKHLATKPTSLLPAHIWPCSHTQGGMLTNRHTHNMTVSWYSRYLRDRESEGKRESERGKQTDMLKRDRSRHR